MVYFFRNALIFMRGWWLDMITQLIYRCLGGKALSDASKTTSGENEK